jgi:serine/threonine protein kinase
LAFAFVARYFRRHIVEQIICCDYKFKGRRWSRVSDQAKDFVRDLLVLDPAERATAEEALGNVWLNRRHRATVRNPTLMEVSQANRSIEAFTGYSKLKKLVS